VTDRLERLLADKNVEIVNLGVGGYGTAQELRVMKELGLSYDPDLVILFFYSNDLDNNSLSLARQLWGPVVNGRAPVASLSPKGELLWEEPLHEENEKRHAKQVAQEESKQAAFASRFLLYELGRSFFQRLPLQTVQLQKTAWDPNVLYGWALHEFPHEYSRVTAGGKSYTTMWAESRRITCRLIHEMASMATEQGIPFVLTHIPNQLQVDPGYQKLAEKEYPAFRFDLDALDVYLTSCAQELAIPFIPLTTAFRRAYEAGKGPFYYSIQDHHWNAEGHRLAAQVLQAELRKRFLP
jgi:hypothetical protein